MSIRDILGRIEDKATWIRDDARNLVEYVNRLDAKRGERRRHSQAFAPSLSWVR